MSNQPLNLIARWQEATKLHLAADRKEPILLFLNVAETLTMR